MKIFTIALFCLTTLTTLISQPTITRSNVYAPGDELYSTESLVIPARGNGGANQTWDFSSVVAEKDIVTLRIAQADTTEYFADYPQSNVASIAEFEGLQNYQYERITDSGLEFLGSVTPGVAQIEYSDPAMFLSFPFTYNSTWQDDYAYIFDFVVSPISVMTEGSLSAVVDGYGTVILPEATFEDVLRIRVIDQSRDTTDLGQGLSERNDILDTTYFWFSASYPGPLCSHSHTLTERTVYLTTPDTVIVDMESEESESFSFDPLAGGSAVTDVQPGKYALNVSPNPFAGDVVVSFQMRGDEEVRFVLQDIRGRVVYESRINAQEGENVETVRLPELPTGPYIAFLHTATSADVQKVMRIGSK